MKRILIGSMPLKKKKLSQELNKLIGKIPDMVYPLKHGTRYVTMDFKDCTLDIKGTFKIKGIIAHGKDFIGKPITEIEFRFNLIKIDSSDRQYEEALIRFITPGGYISYRLVSETRDESFNVIIQGLHNGGF